MKKELKEKAIELRKKGYSFREISENLYIPRSTARLWTGDELLDAIAKERIINLGVEGRRKSLLSNTIKYQREYEQIAHECLALKTNKYDKDDYKVFLALLYWGEGAKTDYDFSFTNSDPMMIRLFLSLLRKAYIIQEYRIRVCIHLHDYHDRIELINFWSKITGVSKKQFYVYNKPHSGISKKPGYKGCLSIRYRDSRIRKEIYIIIKRFRKLTINAGFV